MNEGYPSWIDEYAFSIHRAFIGMVPSQWSSLDGFKAFEALQGTSILRIKELIDALAITGKKPEELFKLFGNPSMLRNVVLFLAWEYEKTLDKNPMLRAAARSVFDWLDVVLSAGMREDKWVADKNIVHSPEEVAAILHDTPWITHDVQAVKDAGKLYVSTASVGFALFRDYFPQTAHEVYGPYDASSVFGEGASLLIKQFPNIRPIELWPEVADFPYEEITTYQIIKGVHFRCEFIGMHSLYDGPVVPNTVAIAPKADTTFTPAKDIVLTANQVAERALAYSTLYEKLDLLAAKQKFAEWEMYQFIRLFEAAGMDWHPTDAMLEKMMAADIPMGTRMDSFPSFEEYVASKDYEIYWLKDLYKN